MRDEIVKIAKEKPSIEMQIAFCRQERGYLERGLILLDDPKQIAEYEIEIIMFREIEENLITIKVQMENKTAASKDAGTYECRNPVREIAEGEENYQWPAIGNSVMVLLEHHGKDEWVDAYVTGHLDPIGIEVKLFWGEVFIVTDPANVETCVPKEVEVCNG